ncbi:hypothetical protein LAZ67_15001111 [Cordylochernes scorpioides]|uniref:Uncharacterized protein n=1 Tax=Cordylochernes scorpioides TaxID=51811 RepID=A0ABY6L8J7_9ARAC|nr:hypothetical protein LAZ67_15001111 [Cordylochernes scorpioides]
MFFPHADNKKQRQGWMLAPKVIGDSQRDRGIGHDTNLDAYHRDMERETLKFVCLLKMTTELPQIQKFNGDNFHLWKFQMKIILEAKDLLSITDGSEVKPEIEDIAKFSNWKKKDAKSKMLITTALEFKYLQQIVNCQTSAEMWKKLSTIYELKSETNKYLLQQRFFENIK